MVRGFLAVVLAIGLTACVGAELDGEENDDGIIDGTDGKIELDMMDDGTIVSKI